jgi:glycosyltransferase involved in cell wall biosynthesis
LTSAHWARDARIFDKECKSLQRNGYEVIEVAAYNGDATVDGIRIKSLPVRRSRISRVVVNGWRCYGEALRLRGDLYHFHDPELIPVGFLLRAQGKRVIYDAHEDLPRTIKSKFYLPRWLRPALAWVVERLENASARRLSAVVTATDTIAVRFRRHNPRTVVVRNFPDLAHLPSAQGVPWDRRPLSVAYIGSLTRVRGVAEVVRAIERVSPELPARLSLAGWYSEDGLERELHGMPGWKRVDWLGRLDPDRVPEALNRVRAGLVVLPPHQNFMAALPVKLFEYMAAGLPVIASDFPLWRQIVEGAGCGLVVDPLDVDAIARAIEFLLSNPREAEAMGRRGRHAVETRYNWEAEERALIAVYQELATATGREQ